MKSVTRNYKIKNNSKKRSWKTETVVQGHKRLDEFGVRIPFFFRGEGEPSERHPAVRIAKK